MARKKTTPAVPKKVEPVVAAEVATIDTTAPEASSDASNQESEENGQRSSTIPEPQDSNSASTGTEPESDPAVGTAPAAEDSLSEEEPTGDQPPVDLDDADQEPATEESEVTDSALEDKVDEEGLEAAALAANELLNVTVTPPVETTPPVDEVLAEPEVLTKPIAEWTLDEVKDFIQGKIKKPASITEKEVVLRGGDFIFEVDHDYKHWGFKDIHNWLKHDKKPTKTIGGFYKLDPLRLSKVATAWTRDELVDFLKGELKATRNASEEELEQAVVLKWQLSELWTADEVKDYVLFNRAPQLTENGYLLNDVVRTKKPAVYWTMSELKAFATGEVSETQAASSKSLFDEIRNRLNISDSYTDERIVQLMKDYVEEPLPMSLIFVQHNLEKYKEKMGKGQPVDEAGAAAAQGLLFNTLSRVLRLEAREFVDGWTMILDFINANISTMFDERHSFRGMSVVQLSDRDRRNFEQLLNLVIKTSNPATRYLEAKNTNFTAALGGVTDETIRQRVLSYYQVGH